MRQTDCPVTVCGVVRMVSVIKSLDQLRQGFDRQRRPRRRKRHRRLVRIAISQGRDRMAAPGSEKTLCPCGSAATGRHTSTPSSSRLTKMVEVSLMSRDCPLLRHARYPRQMRRPACHVHAGCGTLVAGTIGGAEAAYREGSLGHPAPVRPGGCSGSHGRDLLPPQQAVAQGLLIPGPAQRPKTEEQAGSSKSANQGDEPPILPPDHSGSSIQQRRGLDEREDRQPEPTPTR